MSAAGTWTRVDLGALPSPSVVESLDFEAVLSALWADFVDRYPDAADTMRESDPAAKLLEIAAYREVVLRARVNDAARGVLLAFASSSTLDHLGALVPMTRHVGEDDDAFRERVQLAPEAFSVAGPTLAYVWHARAATPDIVDATALSPTPGDVVVTVMSRHGDGGPAGVEVLGEETAILAPAAQVTPPTGATAVRVMLGDVPCARGIDYLYDAPSRMVSRIGAGSIPAGAKVTIQHLTRGEVELARDQLSARLVRPLTDRVTVQAAEILAYTLDVTIWVEPDGPEAELVRQAADQRIRAYAVARHRLGASVTRSGAKAAAHVEGVWRAAALINGGDSDLLVTPTQAGYCIGVAVTVGQGTA